MPVRHICRNRALPVGSFNYPYLKSIFQEGREALRHFLPLRGAVKPRTDTAGDRMMHAKSKGWSVSAFTGMGYATKEDKKRDRLKQNGHGLADGKTPELGGRPPLLLKKEGFYPIFRNFSL